LGKLGEIEDILNLEGISFGETCEKYSFPNVNEQCYPHPGGGFPEPLL
jgi:hypothetical protein